jgi:response regulator RpfG family c-di-GMP phosphodiesterase
LLEEKWALIIENDAHSLLAISSILSDLGIHFKRNTTGENVIEKMRNMTPRPDFVLLNIDLPFNEAFVINHHIQSDPLLCTIPVIALGSVIDFAMRQRLQRDGFATFVLKPLPRRQFGDLVQRILAGEEGWGAFT